MKRFLIDTPVENAEGSQTWFVDAETEEEALEKYWSGSSDLYESNVEVMSLGEPEISGEVPLDDFGDSAVFCAPSATQPAVPLTDELWNLLDAVEKELNRRAIPEVWLLMAHKAGRAYIESRGITDAPEKVGAA